MKLERLLVRNFGTIEGPVEIHVHEGLNVIYGDNESGKSTLLRALWTALTWAPSTSASDVTRWKPYRGGTPHVEIDFRHDAADYELVKTFSSGSGTAKLTRKSDASGVETIQGEEVEKRLRGLLGFGHSEQRRTSYPDHYGLWPLLWVWQWESAREPAGQDPFESPGRTQVAEHLSRETGEALESEKAHAAIEAARTEFESYWTPQGKPTRRSDATIRKAKDALESARARRKELEQKKENYNHHIDRYESLDETIHQIEQELPRKERRAEEAAKRVSEIEQRRRQLEEAEVRRDAAENSVELVRDRIDRRTDMRNKADELRSELEDLTTALNDREETREQLDEQLPDLERQRERVSRERNNARDRAEALEAAREFLDIDASVERLKEKLEQVESRAETVRELEEKRASITVDQETVSDLEHKRAELREARTTLRSAAARVRIEAHDEIELEMDGEPLMLKEGEESEQQLERPTRFELPDVVSFRVEPGGTDLGALRDALEEQEERFREALAAQGVDSLDAAREKLERKRSLDRQIENERALIEQITPEGVEGLREQRTELRAEREKQREVFEERAPENLDLPSDDESARDRLEDAREHARSADSELEELTTELRSLQERRNEISSKIDTIRQRRQDRRGQLDELEENLSSHLDEYGGDDLLEEELESAEGELAEQRRAVDQQREALQNLEPERAKRERERLESVVDQLESDLEERRKERREVRVQIESADLEGLHDRLAAAEAEVEESRTNLERLQRKANAAKLLYRSLERARSALRSTFLRPLRERASRLLDRVLPDATVQFDEDFRIESVTRPDTSSESYGELSGGTSEQVGVLVRLALAELLNEEIDLPLVLDEPFVATDPDRFEAMIPVFRRAANSLQIIVTTHDWRRYRELGLAPEQTHDLERLKLESVEM